MNVDLGIPDILVLILNTLISEALCACLVILPMVVAFTKITPKRVEGTVFAFLTGSYNTAVMVSGISGTVFNQLFVGVTQEDLSNYYVLAEVTIVVTIVPLFYLWLLPTRLNLDTFQKK